MKKRLKIIILFMAVLFTPFTVNAAFDNELKLTATSSTSYQLGNSVAISGDLAIAGAEGANSYTGYIYTFVRDTDTGIWSMQQRIYASDPASMDNFGRSVAISGNIAIVGAYRNDDGGDSSGSAYIYVHDGAGNWTEKKLLASDDAATDNFGWTVAISGDIAIVGAYGDDDNGSGSGSAYLFMHDGAGNWTEKKLLPSDGASSDTFGYSVSISGDVAIVGAPNNDDNGSNSGSAYVFVHDGAGNWTEQKLLPSDGAASDYFGYSVAISGDQAIVGAYGDDDNGNMAGSAYVFVRDGEGNWSEQTKLLASDGAASDLFGMSVAINSNNAIVGANADDDNGNDSGSAYVFINNGAGNWSEQKLMASDGITTDKYGSAVAISGDTAMVGAPWDDDAGSGTGAVYFYGAIVAPNINITAPPPFANNILDFGEVTEFESADLVLTVTNDGDDDLIIGTITVPTLPFSIEIDNCSGQTLTPAANCTITVRFSPDHAFVYNNIRYLEIPSNDPNEDLIRIYTNGTGVGLPVPEITVTDNSGSGVDHTVMFGEISQGYSLSKTVTITNEGTADLNIGMIAALDILQEPFSILNDTCSSQTIVPEDNCTLTVRFAPTSDGEFSDSFDIPSDDADEASITFNLTGTGSVVMVPDISVTDTVLPVNDQIIGFGEVLEGTASDATVIIGNAGTAGLTIGNIADANVLIAPFSIQTDNCSGQTVAPAANCSLTVRFAPTSVGTFNDSFDIPSDDGDENPVIVNISGTGTPVLAPEINVGTLVAFGNVAAGNAVDETFTISNDGTADLTIGNIAEVNPLEAPFSIVEDNCSSVVLASGETCTLTLRFEPASEEIFNDSFDIPSDDADEASVTVNTTGDSGAVKITDGVEEQRNKDGFFGIIGAFNPLILMILLLPTVISRVHRHSRN